MTPAVHSPRIAPPSSTNPFFSIVLSVVDNSVIAVLLTGEYKCLIADTTRFEIGYFYCSVEKAYLHTDADGISCVVVEQYISLFDALNALFCL